MPRPGPRPYECVRKAWHSDRHLPLRGSLIQEIFRLVHEVHKVETKKNKEWQEKLPIVVLKAEEIMYSKANCEAEYLCLSTLGDRVNDAINTIIRIDDESEDGMFLQPCIEAALQLGCIPRRSTRSQRYSNPGCYLTSPTSESLSNKAPMPSPACLGSHKYVNQQYTYSNSKKLCSQPRSFPSFPSHSIYPLHFGDSSLPKSCISDSKTATTPDESHLIGNKIMGPMTNSLETKCDLSLRLGQLDNPSASIARSREINMDVENFVRKRKATTSYPLGDAKSDWQLKVPSKNSLVRMLDL